MRGSEYLKDVVSLQLDAKKCIGCGMCVKVCPHGVFEMQQKKAAIIDRDRCMECGACALNCSEGALFVKQGVGCAAGVIYGILHNTEPTCSCSGSGGACC